MNLKKTIKLILVFAYIVSVSGCENKPLDDSQSRSVSNDILIGNISPSELFDKYPIFKENYQSYQPSKNEIQNFSRLGDFEFKVFFGTWCHDSEREVPRLLKLLDLANISKNQIELIGVDWSKSIPKQHQVLFEVEKTPTIFVVKNGQVLATMIEAPNGTITQHLMRQIFH